MRRWATSWERWETRVGAGARASYLSRKVRGPPEFTRLSPALLTPFLAGVVAPFPGSPAQRPENHLGGESGSRRGEPRPESVVPLGTFLFSCAFPAPCPPNR